MVRRRITVWHTGILLAVLAALALVLVLPQVDLPGIAFRQDHASTIHKSRRSSASLAVVLAGRSRLNFLDEHPGLLYVRRTLSAYPRSTPLPILYSALLC